MLRKTLTFLSLIGLLLSVGLWVRSYVAVYVNTFGHNSSGHGTLMLYRGNVTVAKSGPTPATMGMLVLSPAIWSVRVPMWAITALFAVGLVCSYPFPFHRRRKRKKLGLCVKCGYDLRGSKERCPECGTPFEL